MEMSAYPLQCQTFTDRAFILVTLYKAVSCRTIIETL
jgi:hypothetical protein